MIAFEEVTKKFKGEVFKDSFTALDGVSFTIPQNKIVGFLGANGAGKTTSLKILMDFIRPTDGKVSYDPKVFGTGRYSWRKKIGFLPERPYFYPHLTGKEFLGFLGALAGLSQKQIEDQTRLWAPRFKIEFALDRKIKGYSKGMLQRIGFLATLLHDPSVIVLDEPLSGLDPIGRKDLKEVMLSVFEQGKTVFFSSHIVSDVEEVCQDVIFLKEGKLQYQGSIDQLLNASVTPSFKVTFQSERLPDSFPYRCTVRKSKIQSELFEALVLEEQKDVFIRDLFERGDKLVGVGPNRPTLEEIIYNTKENE